MTELIQLQRQRADPYALLSGAVKQYEDALQQQREERTRGQQMDIQRGQLDLGNRELTSNDTYRKGQLQQGQDTLDFQKNVEAAKNTLALWQKRMDEGDPTVKTEAAQYVQDHPEQAQFLAAAAHWHASFGQQAKGVAEQKHVADNTAVAAGSTDPNANAIYTHDVTSAFPTPQMFTQQQATDLGARAATKGGAPNLKATVPKPSGSAVGDFEARSVGAMTDAGQNQTSQTQITTEGMRQSGETKRKGMEIKAKKDAEAGMPLPSGGGGASDITKATPLVRALVNRDADPAIMRSMMRSADGQKRLNAILAEVQQYDPAFSMADYPTQVATKKGFNTGKEATSVRSINQLIGHLDALDAAGKKLGNSDFPTWNAVGNYVGREMGNTKLQGSLAAYNKAADAVANETETMLRGSSVSGEKERDAVRKGLSQNTTDAERKAAINMTLDLMRSRLTELEDQYTKGVGRQIDFDVLNKHSRAVLQKFGFDAGERTAGSDPKLQEFMSKNGISDETQARKLLHEHGIPGY